MNYYYYFMVIRAGIRGTSGDPMRFMNQS